MIYRITAHITRRPMMTTNLKVPTTKTLVPRSQERRQRQISSSSGILKPKKKISDKSRKKETSVEIKEKPKESKSGLKKAAFRSIAKCLQKVPINTVADFAREIINSELHVKEIENQRNIVQMLEETKGMENLVRNIYLKGIKFTMESLSTILKDRQAVYKIRFTFDVRDMLRDSASNPLKWFHSNKMKMSGDKGDFFCVIHAIAAAIIKFIQSKVIAIGSFHKQ
eukprot:gene10398-11482_t